MPLTRHTASLSSNVPSPRLHVNLSSIHTVSSSTALHKRTLALHHTISIPSLRYLLEIVQRIFVSLHCHTVRLLLFWLTGTAYLPSLTINNYKYAHVSRAMRILLLVLIVTINYTNWHSTKRCLHLINIGVTSDTFYPGIMAKCVRLSDLR